MPSSSSPPRGGFGGFNGFPLPPETGGQSHPDLLSAREPCSADSKQEEKKQQQQAKKKKTAKKQRQWPRYDASKPRSCRSATFGEIALTCICLGMFMLYTSDMNESSYTINSIHTGLEAVRNDVTQLTKEVEGLIKKLDSNVLALTTDPPVESKGATLCDFLLSQFHSVREGVSVLDGRKHAASSSSSSGTL